MASCSFSSVSILCRMTRARPQSSSMVNVLGHTLLPAEGVNGKGQGTKGGTLLV